MHLGTASGRWAWGLCPIPTLSQTEVARASPREPRAIGHWNPPWLPAALVEACLNHQHCPDRRGPKIYQLFFPPEQTEASA